MYTLSSDKLGATLVTATAHNYRAKDGNISVVLLEDVPASLRDDMVRIKQ